MMAKTFVEGSPAQQGTLPLLEVNGISKTYETRTGDQVLALTPVDLQVKPGEIISFVGPSGCGKSTLLNIIAGLLEPTTGTISIGGETRTKPQSDVGFMFQTPVLLPWRTVRQNIF